MSSNPTLVNVTPLQALEHNATPVSNAKMIQIWAKTSNISRKVAAVFRSLPQEVSNEAKRATRHFSRSKNVHTLHRLFQRAANYLPFSKQSAEKKEITSSERLKREIAQLPESDQLKEAPSPLTDPENLRTLSRLPKESDAPSSVSADLLFSLSGAESSKNFQALLSHVSQFIADKYGSSPIDLRAFSKASNRSEIIKQVVQGNIDSDDSERNDELSSEATRLLLDMGSLNPGQSMLYFGKMAESNQPASKGFFDSILKDELPEEVYGLLHDSPDEFTAKIKRHILSNLEKDGFITADSKEAAGKVTAAIQKVIEKSSEAAERVLPENWYHALADSLKEDLRELAVGPRSPEGTQRFAEGIWDQMLEEGIERSIEATASEALSQGRSLINSQVSSITDHIKGKFPSAMQKHMASLGFELDQSQPFWIEIKKQENGLYSLVLFSNDINSEFHGRVTAGEHTGHHLPLVFSDLDPEKLDETFFLRLLSYNAWPSWGKDVNYTLEHLHNALLESLGKKADDPAARTIYPESIAVGDKQWGWLKLYLHHHLNLDESEFSKLCHYELPLKALIAYWPQIRKNPALLQQGPTRLVLQNLISQLSSESVKLFKQGALQQGELEEIYATIWEVEEALKTNVKQTKHLSTALPPEVQGMVQKLLTITGLTPSHVEVLKEACVSVMGEEIEETLDLALEEVLPQLNREQTARPAQRNVPWSEVFGVDGAKRYIAEVKALKPSLLHLYTAYSKASHVIATVFGYSVAMQLMEALLRRHFPFLNKYTLLSVRRIAQLLVLFGPAVLHKILPSEMSQQIGAFFGLFTEVMSYIKRRIALITLRPLFHHILGEKEIAALNRTARSLQQSMMRRGELSFDLPQPKPMSQRIVINIPEEREEKDYGEDQSDISHTAKLPRSVHLPLTVRNLYSNLQKWRMKAQVLGDNQGLGRSIRTRKAQALLFLHEQLRDLPIPGQDGGEIWDQVKSPEDTLELLHPLLLELHELAAGESTSVHEKIEQTTTVYTLYAIIDRLARRCDKAHLPEDLRANGSSLIYLMGAPAIKIISAKTYEKFKDVAAYFRLDPSRRYTEKEIRSYQSDCLFNLKGEGGLFFQPEFLSDAGGDRKEITYLNAKHSIGARYYRKLLEQPKIQRRLALHGVKDDSSFLEKITTLFRDPSMEEGLRTWALKKCKEEKVEREAELSESAKASKGRLKSLLEFGTHVSDDRKGILPRPFYLLRLTHTMAENLIREASVSSHFPELIIGSSPASSFLHRVAKRILSFTQKSAENNFKGTFASRYLDEIKAPFTPPYLTPNMKLSPLRFLNREVGISRRTGEHTRGYEAHVGISSPKEHWKGQKEENSTVLGVRKVTCLPFIGRTEYRMERSQSKIMIDGPLDFGDLLPEEKRILEMINSNQDDQIVRCLDFFTASRNRLSSHRFRSLFDLFINHIPSLEAQLKQRPEITREIGRYFKETIDHFRNQGDLSTALYLTKIGSEILVHCEQWNPNAHQDFPDFVSLINNEIAPEFRRQPVGERQFGKMDDGLITSYCYLVSSYLNLDPKQSPSLEKDRVMFNIARLFYSKIPSDWPDKNADIVLKSHEVFYRWEPVIHEALKENDELRNSLLNSIMQDVGIDSGSESGEWEGVFPIYKKGLYTVDLTRGRCSNSFEISESNTSDLIEERLGVEPGKAVRMSAKAIAYPKIGVTAKLIGCDTVLYREIDGRRYQNLRPLDLPPPFSNADSAFWMEVGSEPPQILSTRDQKIIGRITTKKVEGGYEIVKYERHLGDNVFVRTQSLDEADHDLSLLSWFQPESKTTLVYKEEGDLATLDQIEFRDVDLTFSIRDVNGKKQALCADGKTPGFHIAKKQHNPNLTTYSNYLLLENSKGEKKIHLVTKPIKELIGLFVLKTVGNIPTSALIETTFSSMLKKDSEQKIFTYSLNAAGQLESTDPEAMVYLALLHIAKGEMDQSERYFEQLQSFSRCYPFPPEVMETLDRMLVPLALKGDPRSNQLLLHLVAMRQENMMVHQKETTAVSKKDILRSITAQIAYLSYLDDVKKGAPETLSEHDELFIMKAVGTQVVKGFESVYEELLEDKQSKKWIELIGINSAAEHLMMSPEVSKRYHFLRAKHGENGKWRQRAESLVLHHLFGEAPPAAPQLNLIPNQLFKLPTIQKAPQPTYKRHTDIVSRMVSLFKKTKASAFAQCSKFHTYWKWVSIFRKCSLEETKTDLCDLTASRLKDDFFNYYRLALKQLPKDWEGNPEKENLFAEKVKEFHRNLLLIQGNFPKDWVHLFQTILLGIVKNGRANSYPTADEFIRLYDPAIKYRDIQEEIEKALKAKESDLSKFERKINTLNEELNSLNNCEETEYEKFKNLEKVSQKTNPEIRTLYTETEKYQTFKKRDKELTEKREQEIESKKARKIELDLKIEQLRQQVESLKEDGLDPIKAFDQCLQKIFRKCNINAARKELPKLPELDPVAIGKRVTVAAGNVAVSTSLKMGRFDTAVSGAKSFVSPTSSALKTTLSQAEIIGNGLLRNALGITPLQQAQRILNGGLSIGTGLWHAVNHIKKQEELANTEEAKQGAVSSSRAELPEQLKESMTQRENAINRVMKGLLDHYFDVTQQPNQQDRRAEHFEVPQDEADVRSAFEKVNQSIDDFYTRPTKEKNSYKLKAEKSAKQLGQDLVQLRKEVAGKLLAERQYIEKYTNHPFKNGETEQQILLQKLTHGKAQSGNLSFKEITDAFIRNDLEGLLKRSKMKPEHLSHLKERLYLYHVMTSRWNLLFERIEGLTEPTDAALNKVGEELDRRRAYTFDDNPERLIRGKLVFEARTRKMLWDKQSHQIDRLLTSPNKQLVVELIMGSGKTWYGIPETDYFSADGNALVINIWPAPVAKTNISTIGKQSKTIFSQVANAMNITRAIGWTKERLWGISRVFERTREEKQQMNMTKESLQALELCFIEQSLDLDGKFSKATDWKERIGLFRKTLALIRQKGKGCIDEAHVAFAQGKELNHPVGKSKCLKKKFVNVITETLLYMSTDSEMNQFLTIKSKIPTPLPPEEFKANIRLLLAKRLATCEDFEIEEENREAFIAYISGEAEEIPAFAKKGSKYAEICLAKGLLTVLLQQALSGTIHVDTNVSKKGSGEFVRPSEGYDNPSERSTIRSAFEALVKTGINALHDRLSAKQLNQLILFLKRKAEAESKVRSCRKEATLAARFFKLHCPGHELFTFSKNQRPEVRRLLNKSDRVVLTYIKYFVAKQIRYFDLNLSSNSSDFALMFESFFSDTGTPFNAGSYLKGTEVLSDPGTAGDSVDIMDKICSDPENTTVLNEESPEELLEKVIELFFAQDSNARAFIDRGAIFNGLSSRKIAERLVQYITESRPELEGVAFYLDSQLMIWEKDADHPIPIEQSTIPKEKRLSYFPQPQTYAADIPQIEGAVGIVSISEDTKSNELEQAIHRMRGLRKSGQKLKFVMTKKTRDRISGQLMPTNRTNQKRAVRNEGKMLGEDDYQADRKEMASVLRRAILDKALFAPTVDQAVKIIKDNQDVFVTKVEDDPIALFGLIDDMVEPAKVFEALRARLIQKAKKSGLFSREERTKIESRLNTIGRGNYPEKVHCYKSDNGVEAGVLDDLGKSSQVEEEGDEEAERVEEAEEDMELQQNLQQEQCANHVKERAQIFRPWPKNLNPTKLSEWLTITKAPDPVTESALTQTGLAVVNQFVPQMPGITLFKLRDVIAKSEQEGSDNVAAKLSPSIYASNNVAHLIAASGCPIEPFGKSQIPLFEAVVIKKNDHPTQLILVDQKEAAYWRKKLEEDRAGAYERDPNVKIGLYDISLGGLVAEGHRKFDEDEIKKEFLFRRAVVQLKFLRGDVKYDKEQAKLITPWLRTELSMMKFFESVHQNHARNCYQGSDLEKIVFELENRHKSQQIRI